MAIPLVFLLGDRRSARPAGCSTACWSRWGRVPALVVTLGTLYVFRGARLPVDQRPPGQRRDAARRLPEPRQRLDRSASRSSSLIALVVVLVVGQWLRDYRAGPRAVRDRLQPRGRPPRRRARRSAACWRRSCSRGALAGLAGVLFTARFGTVDATAGHRLRADGRRRGRRRRRRHLRRHRHASTAPRSAPCCSATIRRSLIVLQVNPFWQQAIDRRPAAGRHRARPPARAARRGAPCAGGARAVQLSAAPRARRGRRLGRDWRARSAAGRRCWSAC